MVFEAQTFKYKVLDSELEALLTEAELIRRYQPPYNVLLKDDKSPLYIVITKEKYPRVLQVRKKELNRFAGAGASFGPFQSAYRVREVLKLVRPIFPWCNQAGDLSKLSDKPCFYYHIDRCPGACLGKITPEKYQENIDKLSTFLRGRTSTVIKKLNLEMQEEAGGENFEEAIKIRDTIELIDEVTHQNKYLRPELTTPGLTAKTASDGPVYLRDILAEYLHLSRQYPLKRIECYDVSNIQGKHASVAMVTFTDGRPDLSQYRLFNIRSIDTPNDFYMLREAIARRQNHPEWGVPDLIIIDGGRGQVRSVLMEWTWQVPVIGIAKNPDRLVIPLIDFPEQIVKIKRNTPIKYQLLKLSPTHPGLKLVQQLRDEAHRFSKKQHKRRWKKDLLG